MHSNPNLVSLQHGSKFPNNMQGVAGSSPSPRTLSKLPPAPFRGQAKQWWVEWNKKLGLPECPYLIRWVAGTPFGSTRLHHWRGSDDLRNTHDHPWWFFTIVLWGGYWDITEDGAQRMRAGSFAFRPALHRHSVKVDQGGCWTIMICGPEIRDWGFWVAGVFRKANKYFLKYKHHPCN
jgi:hypothetical protein